MLADEEIGGGIVRRTFTRGNHHMKRGDRLTADEIMSFQEANRRALIEAGYLEVWPKPPVEYDGDVTIVHIGGGRYDVYARKLNPEPLTRDEAELMAKRLAN